MSQRAATLTGIEPRGVIEGARLWLRGDGLPAPPPPEAAISVGGVTARVVFSSPDRVAVIVPPAAAPGRAPVRATWAPGATLFVDVGVELATGLHAVDSPAVGGDGSIYVAFSGPRGQESAVSVYRVSPEGGREAFVEGIVNATSLAISPDGVLHVSSRYTGTVYRIAPDGTSEPAATELGVACGLAFAPDGSLFVGDRTGTIHRVVDGGARVETFASLPPSVAAFHLAMGPDEKLYVTAPTLSTSRRRPPVRRLGPGRSARRHVRPAAGAGLRRPRCAARGRSAGRSERGVPARRGRSPPAGDGRAGADRRGLHRRRPDAHRHDRQPVRVSARTVIAPPGRPC